MTLPKPSRFRCHGFFSMAAIVPCLFLTQLVCTIHPTSAIGGWETIHIFFRRIAGERAASRIENLKSSPKSPQERIAPVPSGGESSGSKVSEEEGGKIGAKKRHVSEVTMTSSLMTAKSSHGASVVTDASTHGISPRSPAFTRGRRGGILDEEDLKTISFVGSLPFL